MRNVLYITSVFLVTASLTYGQYETGTGARAFALANNHTALSAGISDLYWNPAAMAFSVSREFQGSLYGMKLMGSSTFFGNTEDDDLQRFRIGNAGFSFAVPASRGGMSFAGSYSNPIILDDVFSFSGDYLNNDSTVSVNERSYRCTGNLDFWSAGFGVQIAKDFGIGLSASLITGKSTSESYLDKNTLYQNTRDNTYTNYDANGSYLGYDIRAGLFYKTELWQTGARLVFPRVIHYTDNAWGTYENIDFDEMTEYNMYSSYSGAWGISAMFPYFTITAEIRTTLPYDYLFPVDKIPDDCQAGYFKTGGGAGIEVPVSAIPAVVRLGYSCDELDLHPWMYNYIDESDNSINLDWTDAGMKVNRKIHKITCGIGFTSATTSFDISYGLSTWGITTSKNLDQTYYLHRVLTSFAVRF